MDHLTKEDRSWNMAQIRSKDTGPEKLLRSYLHKQGYRFRLHNKELPGKPDLVLRKYNSVIFVNGCFWHQHKRCKRSSIPKSNRSYWRKKLNGNIERDNQNKKLLNKQGWHIITVWECQLKAPDRVINRINNRFAEYEK